LTPAGLLFKEAAEDILRKLFDTRSIIRTDERIQGTGLRIAAGHTLSVSFLPSWLNGLNQTFGDFSVRVCRPTSTIRS
jgi:LysR family transcriptional regulator, hypochlorite-specific transcription factor HypT